MKLRIWLAVCSERADFDCLPCIWKPLFSFKNMCFVLPMFFYKSSAIGMCIPASTTAASLAASAASTSAASSSRLSCCCLVFFVVLVCFAVWNCPLKIVYTIFYLADCHCVVVSFSTCFFGLPCSAFQRSPSNPLEKHSSMRVALRN